MGTLTTGLSQLPLAASRVCIRNTFLDFEEEDDEAPWIIGDARRLHTDSIISRSSQSLLLSQQHGLLAGLPDRLDILPLKVEGADATARYSRLGGLPAASLVHSVRPATSPFTLPSTDLTGIARMKAEAFRAVTEESLQSHVDVGFEPDESEDVEEEPEPAPAADSDGHSSPGSPGMAQDNFKDKVSVELIRSRDLALNGGGLSGCTTVMVRHIPGKYTQQKLMREINSAGFLGKYDFFYLPMQMQSRGNRSFAFLNFVSSEAAQAFYNCFHGRRLRHFRAGQPVTVAPADVQGFEENALHYAKMRRAGSRYPLHSGHALFFKPLPPGVLDHEDEGAQPWETAPAPGWEPLKQQPPRQVATARAPAMQTAPRLARFCTQCGQPKPAEHVFCAFCGARGWPMQAAH